MAPALALAACGVPANTEVDAKLARAEGAAVRAEAAQRAAEAAAAQAEAAKAVPEPEASENPELDESQVEAARSRNENMGNNASGT